MAFGGLKKLIRKNKGGLKKLAKLGGQYALSAALPVIGSKLATTAVGVVVKARGAGARRKVKAEKADKINKALAAEIQRPQLAMTASRETGSATYGPGGARAIGGGRKKSSASYGPGGATVNQMSKAASAQKGTPLGISSAVGGFIKKQIAEKRSSDKVKAAALRKKAAADKKAAAAALRRQKAEERKAASAAKKAAKSQKASVIQEVAASALGVKLGKSKTAKAAAGKITRTISSRTKAAVKGSLKGSKIVPAVGLTAGVLYAGGKALDANAASQVKKAEKKLGRKLTEKEIIRVTTPVNTFAGK